MLDNYELYIGCDILVDYKSQLNQDVIDFFEDASNFEGFATLNSIDFNEGLFTIKGLSDDYISLEYLMAMNINTNEFEYIYLDKKDLS